MVLLVLLSSCVFAQTQEVVTNVSVVCSAEGSCAAAWPGATPVLFAAANYSGVFAVVSSFTYEPNETIVVNTTTVTVQNVSVSTTNVTVVQCNQTPNVSLSSAEVAQALNASLADTCRLACDLSDGNRTALQDELRYAKEDLAAGRAKWEANVTATMAVYEAQLNITRQQITQVEGERNQWIFLALLVLAAGVVYVVIEWRMGKIGKIKVGSESAPGIEVGAPRELRGELPPIGEVGDGKR